MPCSCTSGTDDLPRIQFQWRADKRPDRAPPNPQNVLRALVAFAQTHGLELREHGQLLGHFHAPWITIWRPGPGSRMLIAIRYWAGCTSEGGGAIGKNGQAAAIYDVSLDNGLAWIQRSDLWNVWRLFPQLEPVWTRGTEWHSSASRRLRRSAIPQPAEPRSVDAMRRTLHYWER